MRSQDVKLGTLVQVSELHSKLAYQGQTGI
jgi:hypothetical protein